MNNARKEKSKTNPSTRLRIDGERSQTTNPSSRLRIDGERSQTTNPSSRLRIGGERSRTTKNWSGYVTKHSFALALERDVFTWDDPRKIAQSLKKSAEESLRRKGTPFQSAMSMLNFYLNRAGKNLKPARKRILEQAKIELRTLFNYHLK